jgi:hypothetical protein
MWQMQQKMREDFMLQVGQLELRLEKNMKPMITDFHECVNTLMVQIQTVADNVMTNANLNDAKYDQIIDLIESLGKRSLPTPEGTPIRNPDKCIRGHNDDATELMPIDHNLYEANGSLQYNPTASRAITPTAGKNVSAGATK